MQFLTGNISSCILGPFCGIRSGKSADVVRSVYSKRCPLAYVTLTVLFVAPTRVRATIKLPVNS